MAAALRACGRAVGLAVFTLVLISVVTFAATNVVPSDPARLALGRAASEDQLKLYRQQQHLDTPVVQRYVEWLGDFLRGDWGTSALNRQPVKAEVLPRVTRTVIAGFIAMSIAVPLAFLVGVYTGERSGSRTDIGASSITLLLNSLPEFVVGLLLLMIFAVQLKILPVESSGVAFGEGITRVRGYVLPVLTLIVVMTPYLIRMVRVNVRDVVDEPYVQSAVLRGLSHRRITWRYVASNASLPVISVVALSTAELVGGIVVIEAVFGFPGVGKLLVDSVLGGDIPVVQAIALIVGLGFVCLNLIADLLLVAMNPRLRT
jgi:peptide/nickel transport system permease protein